MIASIVLPGCGDEPSFRVRWAVAPFVTAEDEPIAATLESSVDCSSRGIMAVRITTRDAFGTTVDARTRPCFPPELEDPDGAVDGPALPAGPYAVEVRGVRRDHVGWTRGLDALEAEAPNPGCVPELGVASPKQDPRCALEMLACDCSFVEVADDRTALLDPFEIAAPPECEDGVDNDGDGLVDMFDPACRLGHEREDTVVVANAQLVMRVSVLDDNPVATCNPLGISRFIVTFDDVMVAEPVCEDVLGRTFQASAMMTQAGATHTVGVVAVDPARRELTIRKDATIDVPDAGGGRFPIDVDFSPDDFLEPIVDSTTLLPRFLPYEGAGFDRGCDKTSPLYGGGRLDLAELRMRMIGPHGQELIPPAELENGTPLDGATTFACDKDFTTQALRWGEYQVEIEALSTEGEVCFSNVGAPALTAPGNMFPVIPRVFPLPASCHDCTTDGDCFEHRAICDEGLCRPTCLTNEDCPAGITCQDGLCGE